jgi:hypothetical protein
MTVLFLYIARWCSWLHSNGAYRWAKGECKSDHKGQRDSVMRPPWDCQKPPAIIKKASANNAIRVATVGRIIGFAGITAMAEEILRNNR